MPIRPLSQRPTSQPTPQAPRSAPSQDFIVPPRPQRLSPSVFDDTEFDDEDQNLKGGGRFQKVMDFLGLGARVAGGAASNMGGAPGAAIGAAVEGVAQGLENIPKFGQVPGALKDIYGNLKDPYKNTDFDAPSVNKSMAAGFGTEMAQSAGRMGVEAAMSAVPMSSVTKAGRMAESFGKNAALSGAGEVGREVVRGEEVSPGRVGLSALFGGTVGAGVSRFMPDIGPPVPSKFRDGRDLPKLAPKPRGEAPLTPQEAAARGNSARAASPQMATIETSGGQPLRQTQIGGTVRNPQPPSGGGSRVPYGVPSAVKGAEPVDDIDTLERLFRTSMNRADSRQIQLAKKSAEEGKLLAEELKLAQIQAEMEAAGAQPKTPTFGETLTAKSPDGTSTTMRTGFETPEDKIDELSDILGWSGKPKKGAPAAPMSVADDDSRGPLPIRVSEPISPTTPSPTPVAPQADNWWDELPPYEGPVAAQQPKPSIPISVEGPQVVSDDKFAELMSFFKSPKEASGAHYGQVKKAVESGAEPKLQETLPIPPDSRGRPYTAERIAGKNANAKNVARPKAVPPVGDTRLATVPKMVDDPEMGSKNAKLRKLLGIEDDFTIEDNPNLIKAGETVPETSGSWIDDALKEIEDIRTPKVEDPSIRYAQEAAEREAGRERQLMDLLRERDDLKRSLNVTPKGGVNSPFRPQAETLPTGNAPTPKNPAQAGHPGMVGKLTNPPAASPSMGMQQAAVVEPKPKLVKTKKEPKVSSGIDDDDVTLPQSATPVPPGSSQPKGLSHGDIKNLMDKGISPEEMGKRSMDELRAILSTSTDKMKNPPKLGDPTGSAQTEILANIAGIGIGGATGAALDNEGSPIEGALGGAALGAGVANAPRIARNMTGGPSDEVKGVLGKIWEELPHVVRANYLTSGIGLPANAAVGPYMSGLTGAIEAGLKGDERGWAAMKLLMSKEVKDQIGPAFQESRGAIENAERRTLGRAPTKLDHALSFPGRMLTTGDITIRNILKQAGFSEDEAKLITMTNEPTSRFGKALVNLQRTGGPLANLLLPFVRTPMNMLEQGMKRLPIAGAAYQRLKPNPSTWREIGAEQAVSGVTGLAAYGAGAVTPQDNKSVRRYVSNAGGRNALTANLGFLLGQNSQSPTSNNGNTIAQGIGNALTLPQTDPVEDSIRLAGKLYSGDASMKDLPGGMYPKVVDEIMEGLNPAPASRSLPTSTATQGRLRSIRERRGQ